MIRLVRVASVLKALVFLGGSYQGVVSLELPGLSTDGPLQHPFSWLSHAESDQHPVPLCTGDIPSVVSGRPGKRGWPTGQSEQYEYILCI